MWIDTPTIATSFAAELASYGATIDGYQTGLTHLFEMVMAQDKKIDGIPNLILPAAFTIVITLISATADIVYQISSISKPCTRK